jgi:hypothetical protein
MTKRKIAILLLLLLVSSLVFGTGNADAASLYQEDGGCGEDEKAVCLLATNETVCPSKPVADYLITVGAAEDGCCEKDTPPEEDGAGPSVVVPEALPKKKCEGDCPWVTLHTVLSVPGDCRGALVFYTSRGTYGDPVLNVGSGVVPVLFSHPATAEELAMVEGLDINSSMPIQVGYVNVAVYGSDLGVVQLAFANKMSNQFTATGLNTCP